MPSAPPVIYTPPGAASPGTAPKIYEAAPAGKQALTIASAVTAGVNGVVFYAGLIQGQPCWSTNGTQTAGAGNVIVEYTGTAWKVSLSSSYSATKTSAATSPEGLTTWTVGTGSGSPTITAAAQTAPPVITA